VSRQIGSAHVEGFNGLFSYPLLQNRSLVVSNRLLGRKMSTKDWIQLGVAPVRMVVGPCFAVWLFLRQFHRQKWWEIRKNAIRTYQRIQR